MEKKIGKKSIIALVAIVVVIIVVLAIALQPGDDLSGTLTDQSAQIVENDRVSNGETAFDNVNPKGEKIDVKFKASDADGASAINSNPSSHIQGYARYRGTNEETETNYDFHIFPYSNLSGKQGYLWFVSDNEQFNIKLTPDVKIDEESNCYFNHPTGLQIIGDYLVVGVIPAEGMLLSADFKSASETYIIDLSPLKAEKPTVPTEIKKINEFPYIKDTKGRIVGSLSCVGVTEFNGKYLIGYIADSTLVIYESEEKTNIWDASNYTLIRTHYLDHGDKDYHYQSMGFYRDKAGDIYMVGFDERSSKDYCDLFKLTEENEKKEIVLINDTASPYIFLREKHATLNSSVEFSNGGGIEIFNGELYCYGSEAYAGLYDDNATINILPPKN